MAGNRRAKTFQCPSCGSPQELVALGHSKTFACPACSSILDLTKPEFEIITKYQEAIDKPLIPLGSRGQFNNITFEVIGFMIRCDGSRMYQWREYLLFNPYHGFRWLVESNGHWNYGTPIKEHPAMHRISDQHTNQAAIYQDATYKRFLRGQSITLFVLGEFYWEVRQEDSATTADYISPPHMLSVEESAGEINWSLLEYVNDKTFQKAFPYLKKLPRRTGIAPNQLNSAKILFGKAVFASVISIVALLCLEFVLGRIQQNKTLFQREFSVAGNDQSKIRVIPEIQITGRTSNLQLRSQSPVTNSWVYHDFELFNLQTGQTFGSDAEVSFYEGQSSDGYWSEGSREKSAILSAVPAGRYSLTIDSEIPPLIDNVNFELDVRRDVPYYTNVIFASVLLTIAPMIFGIFAASFETRRWEDSEP